MTGQKAGLARLTEHEALRGVAIGECVAGEDWSDADVGHLVGVAHGHWTGKYKGWVCVRGIGGYTKTTIGHELAHIIVGHKVHNERWRRTMRSLGCRVERAYRKR